MANYKYYYKNITIITEDVINYYKNNPKIAEKQYQSLIKSRKTFIKSEEDTGYYEKHHILPRCLGGDDSKDNLILLTYPEHVFAHLCLISIYSNDSNYFRLLHAFCMMLSITTRSFDKEKKFSETDFSIDLEVLGRIRKELAENPERREVLRQKMIERWKDPEFREKQDEFKSNEEYLQRQRQLTKERWKDPEFRKKVLDSNSKTYSSLEYRLKCSRIQKSLWEKPEFQDMRRKINQSPEHIQKMKETRAEVLSRPEFQEKMEKIRNSDEYKQHLSEARIKTWKDDNYQAVFCKRVQGPDGNVCRSVKQASRTYHIPETTLTDWLRHKPEKGYKYITEDEYQSRKND